MKKFLAILLTILMLSLPTLCHADEIDISDWVEVDLPDISMYFYRPDCLTVSEDPAADSGNASCTWYGTGEDMTAAIFVIADNGSTLNDVAASLTESGYTANVNYLADYGLTYDHLAVSVEGNDSYGAIVFQGTDGCFYIFECTALSDLGAAEFGTMLVTLAPIEYEE